MSQYPCTEIITEGNVAVTVFGPYFHVFDIQSGKLLQTTAPTASKVHSKLSASFAIRNVAISLVGRHLATVDEQKKLKVWDLDTLKLLSTRELPKKPNQVIITKDGHTIVVADKFGDVFSYPVIAPDVPKQAPPPPPPPNTYEGRKSLVSHANPSCGTLVLGHTSSLLAMVLTSDERFLLTADRDEHIRVSHFPQGYRIERFCLGHTKYVSALHLPSHMPATLISGGGDHHIYAWDYITGELKGRLEVWSHIRPLMVAQSQRRKFQRIETKAGSGWGARTRREREARETHEDESKSPATTGTMTLGQLEDKSSYQEADFSANEGGVDGVVNGAMTAIDTEVANGTRTSATGDIAQSAAEPSTRLGKVNLPALEDIIVISKINTLRFASTYAVIFSAIGARALFFARYNYNSHDDTWTLDDKVYQHIFSKPVLDFSVSSSEHGINRIWAAIDHTFSLSDITTTTTASGAASGPGDHVMETYTIAAAAAVANAEPADISSPEYVNSSTLRLLEWNGGDKLEEVTSISVPLLYTLRNLDPVPATPNDLEILDLYGLLTALPKTEELEDSEVAGAIIMEGIKITGAQGATRTKLELKEAVADEGMESIESIASRDPAELSNLTNTNTKNVTSTANITNVINAKAPTTMISMSTSSAPTTSTISSSRENLGGTRRDDSSRSAQSQQTGETVTESNKREVKKQGRKKWQMKMESRQQHQSPELNGSGTLQLGTAIDSISGTPTADTIEVDTITNTIEVTDAVDATGATENSSNSANKRDRKNTKNVTSSSWSKEGTSSRPEEMENIMDVDTALEMETETRMPTGKGKGVDRVLEMEKGKPMEMGMDIEGETGVNKEGMSSEVGKKISRTARTGDDDVDLAHSSDEHVERVTKKARTSAR